MRPTGVAWTPPSSLLVGELRTKRATNPRLLDHYVPLPRITSYYHSEVERGGMEDVTTDGDPRKTSSGICLISSYGVPFSHPRTRGAVVVAIDRKEEDEC